MDGIHDLGGMQGFGPVDPEDDEPFHEAWERRFHGLGKVLGVHGLYTLDEKRHLREQLHPAAYLTAGYWEGRYITTEQALVRRGVLGPEEVDERLGLENPAETEVGDGDGDLLQRVKESMATNATFDREPKPPQFAVGDPVIARNIHPDGHTRLPQYVRRARGEVMDFHGTQMFPDAAAEGDRDVGEPLYTVRFDAPELWGESSPDADSVMLQLFEPYLREP